MFFCSFRAVGAICAFTLIYNRDTYISYILSFRALRFIGRQSYCAYVWHFPAIVLMNKIGGLYWLRAIYISIAVCCAYFEDKITNSKSKKAVPCIILLYFIIVGIMAAVYFSCEWFVLHIYNIRIIVVFLFNNLSMIFWVKIFYSQWFLSNSKLPQWFA